MSEDTKNSSAQTPDSPDSPDLTAAKPESVPQEKRRQRALVNYLAVMFVVAFLLVLLSFLIQLRDSRATISELNQSSLSALSNAQILQASNEQLTDENADLLGKNETLSDALDALQTKQEALTQLQEQTEQQLADTISAYELLSKAQNALGAGDMATLTTVMTALEPLQSQFTGESAQQYAALKQAAQPKN
ncbi:MAG: hypothetical protein PHS97_05420 [Oscillospiraceae bacterium]|nr:hypothetical protein [Oscillospiraceae bacterium]